MPPAAKERPLSDDEVRKLRDLIEADSRVRWFWASIRTYAVWVSAVVLGLTVGWESLGKILRALIAK